MSSFESIDFFTDPSLVPDPHPYFDYLRAQNPVLRLPHHGVVAITGYDEATEVYKNPDIFSNIVALGGPFPPLPFTPEGDDISAQIDEHRSSLPDERAHGHHGPTGPHPCPVGAEQAADAEPAEAQRRVHVEPRRPPTRRVPAQRQVRVHRRILQAVCHFGDRRPARCPGGGPQGVPRPSWAPTARAHVGALDHESVGINPLEWLDDKFCSYIEDRRRDPRDDVLTSLATALYPDGSTPEVIEMSRSATFLFAAGQETTAKLLSAALQVIGDRPDIQQRLRDDRSLIPGFIEESLRMDSPVKSDCRLPQGGTTIGGVDIPVGTVVMVLPGAANRDPRRFENPHEFQIDRKNVREHMAFARGVHSCPGGPLARVEGRVSIERILDRMPHIEIDESAARAGDDRRYEYEPTYILRGLRELH